MFPQEQAICVFFLNQMRAVQRWPTASILPAEAEEGEVESQQSRHHMSDEGTGFTGMKEETKPKGRQQSAELTHHKVYLQTERDEDTPGGERLQVRSCD